LLPDKASSEEGAEYSQASSPSSLTAHVAKPTLGKILDSKVCAYKPLSNGVTDINARIPQLATTGCLAQTMGQQFCHPGI